MDFVFQGFQSPLPFWVYLVVIIATTALARWSYQNITKINPALRYSLIALRSAVFFIIIILLLNPIFQSTQDSYKKPRILVMLDNSASTALHKNKYEGLKSYKNVIADLSLNDSSRINFDFYLTGNQTNFAPPQDLKADEDQTDLMEAIYAIRSQQPDAQAAILISDGIYTKGQNPVYATKQIDIPIFTVGLGDTTDQKDIIVSSVNTNNDGYLNTTQPVKATIKSLGFAGKPFQVYLKKDDKMIGSQIITPNTSKQNNEVTFDLKLKKEGLQQYQISVPKLADEWSSENNTQLFSINVLDARQQILSLAFEVYPDVKFVRSLLLQDKNTHLSSRTWIKEDRFVEGSLNIDPDTLDLVILQGFPKTGLPPSIQKWLTTMSKKIPQIVEATPLFGYEQFNRKVTSLPFYAPNSTDYKPVSLLPSANTKSHPVMELPAVNYGDLPVLYAPVKNLRAKNTAKVLFESKFEGEKTHSPVLSTQQIGNIRKSFFSAFGWYKLSQSSNPTIRKFVRKLWLNTISWTAANPSEEKLRVEPAKTSFNGSEPVIIDAYLKNERGEMESNGSLQLTVSSDSLKPNNYAMQNLGSGHYRLNMGTMPEGLYSFNAKARKDDRIIDSKRGEFAVARSNAEFVNTDRNERLLRQLAQKTGGRYTPYDKLAGFWKPLRDQGLLKQVKETNSHFFYLYRNLIWFIVVILLLGSEWLLRKYVSLP